MRTAEEAGRCVRGRFAAERSFAVVSVFFALLLSLNAEHSIRMTPISPRSPLRQLQAEFFQTQLRALTEESKGIGDEASKAASEVINIPIK